MNLDKLRKIIREEIHEASAGEEAKKKGLTHVGFGNYADKSGKVVARSSNGKLVTVSSSSANNTTNKQADTEYDYDNMKSNEISHAANKHMEKRERIEKIQRSTLRKLSKSTARKFLDKNFLKSKNPIDDIDSAISAASDAGDEESVRLLDNTKRSLIDSQTYIDKHKAAEAELIKHYKPAKDREQSATRAQIKKKTEDPKYRAKVAKMRKKWAQDDDYDY